MDCIWAEMWWCYSLGSVSMCGPRLGSWSCWSMEGTLMPWRWEGMRGMDQFAKLQKRRFAVQGGYICGSTVNCWEWASGGQSWASRMKSWLLVGSVVSWLNRWLILFHLLVWLLISFSWLEERWDGLCQQWWQLLLGVMAMGAFRRRIEWWVLKVSLLLSGFPFWNGIGKIRINEHVGCRWRCRGCGAKISVGIRLIRHGGWHCCCRLL